MPIVIAYASDHSPENMKKRAVGFIYCAIPIGGLLSGVVMQAGLFGSDWRPVYLVGGIAPIVVAPFLFLLPKSLPRTKNSPESPSSQVEYTFRIIGRGAILHNNLSLDGQLWNIAGNVSFADMDAVTSCGHGFIPTAVAIYSDAL